MPCAAEGGGDDWDLTLGTDFSGMETVRMALQNSGYKVNQRFRCEIDQSCRTVAAALFPDCGTTFTDIRTRNFVDAPATDLYVAGVFCPPWSSASVNGGEACATHVACSGGTRLPT